MKMCKYTKSIVFFFALLTVSCSMQEKDFKDNRENPGRVFYASIEVPVGEAETKVYADDDLSVLWHEDDRVSIFNKNTYNQEYRFTGKTGSNAGSFEKVTSGGFVTGNPLSSVYSVYPYSASTEISNQGLISVDLPSTQTYAQHSFGPKANTMVSVPSDEMLLFKNVGGYLVLRLYGENVEVSSITLKGNNNEKLAGKATVSITAGGNPSVDMSNDAAKEITLTCENPVTIGNTAAGYTEFWFVTPPVSFSKGISIRVNGPNGSYFEKSSSKAISIGRNTISRMAAIEVEFSGGEEGFVVFKDDNFKAYCVENFDTDNDGKISIDEALAVTAIDVCTDNITSLSGVECFTNLESLSATGSAAMYKYGEESYTYNGEVSNLPDCEIGTSVASGSLSYVDLSGLVNLEVVDVSNNNISEFNFKNCSKLRLITCNYCNLAELNLSQNSALTELECRNNRLVSLDVSKNSALTTLNCYYNQLSTLDVSKNTALVYLRCNNNQISTLDVSNNTALAIYNCHNNKLSALDISKNTELIHLSCVSNQLLALDVSNNTVIQTIQCSDNQLTSLNIENNTTLTSLSCLNNQLSTLDVSHNPALKALSCSYNPLTVLDVRENTALTTLNCYNCKLTTLDVSNNAALKYLVCYNNPYLTEIWLRVGQSIESFNYFSYDTNVATIKFKGEDPSENIIFADANIKAKLVAAFDSNGDRELSYAEAEAVNSGNDLRNAFSGDRTYKSFDEFRYFTGITTLESSQFGGWGALESIILPPSLVSIGLYSFQGCNHLKSFVIPEGVTAIGEYAFDCCLRLESISVPESITTISGTAFYGCDSLKMFISPLSSEDGRCLIINDELVGFASKGIEEYSIPNGVTAIGSYVLSYCSELSRIIIPSSVVTIGNWAFHKCKKLTEVVMSDGVTYIGDRAFYLCSALTEIELSESVSSIGFNAFEGCSLKALRINSVTPPQLIGRIFSNIDDDFRIYVPYESLYTYKNHQFWGEYTDRFLPLPGIYKDEYVDMGLSVKWATCNLGTSKPELFGDNYAWGETERFVGYPQTSDISSYSFNPSGDESTFTKYTGNDYEVLQPEDDIANIKLGGKWRIPIADDWRELMNKDNCDWVWGTMNEKRGYTVTSKITGNSIFLPIGDYLEVGYWSSTLCVDEPFKAYSFNFQSYPLHVAAAYVYLYARGRGTGLFIRPVRE